MNETLARICALLTGQKPEHQMAAAIVLSELGVREPAAIKALCASLTNGSRSLRLLVLEALGRTGSAAAVPSLLAMIESTDDEVREKATRALIELGTAAVKPAAARILDSPPSARRALIAILSRVKTPDSIQALLALAGAGHPEASREAAGALVTMSHGMTRPEQTRLRGMAEKILKTPPDKAPAGALSAALHVISSVGQPGDARNLLRILKPAYPEMVRRDALLAISGVLKGGIVPPPVLSGILPILMDGPSPALRSASIEVLGTLKLPSTSLDALLKLTGHSDPAVRRFAARKLGSDGSWGLKACKRLVALLGDADPSLRDAASESLARLPESVPLLMEELLACDDVHRGWVMAHILKHHVPRLRRPTVRSLFEQAVAALGRDERVWEPQLYVVRQHDPKLMYEWLMAEAARLRKARKFTESEACLRPLTSGEHFDSEARYALALAGISASRSKGSGASTGPAASIDLFRQLVRDPAFPLVERLKKERGDLGTEDLYHLGFKLSEGTPLEKEVGGELLRIVAARAGASRLGKSARSKLRAQGLGL